MWLELASSLLIFRSARQLEKLDVSDWCHGCSSCSFCHCHSRSCFDPYILAAEWPLFESNSWDWLNQGLVTVFTRPGLLTGVLRRLRKIFSLVQPIPALVSEMNSGRNWLTLFQVSDEWMLSSFFSSVFSFGIILTLTKRWWSTLTIFSLLFLCIAWVCYKENERKKW